METGVILKVPGVMQLSMATGSIFPIVYPELSITLMNSSLNPPFEMGDQAKPKRCLEY